jgi:hypothetical protein
MSRRSFLHAAAGTFGALGAGVLWPTRSLAAGRDPKPIPLTRVALGVPIHVNGVGPADAAASPGNEPSTITDFDGYIGVARVQGTGTGTNTNTGETFPLLFDSDMRFMQGIYQSVDGRFLDARFVLV